LDLSTGVTTDGVTTDGVTTDGVTTEREFLAAGDNGQAYPDSARGGPGPSGLSAVWWGRWTSVTALRLSGGAWEVSGHARLYHSRRLHGLRLTLVLPERRARSQARNRIRRHCSLHILPATSGHT